MIACADQHRVPAGRRSRSSGSASRARSRGGSRCTRGSASSGAALDELPDGPVIVRTGPLTEGELGEVIRASSAAIACTSTTRSRRSSRPTRSTGISRSAHRAGAATATDAPGAKYGDARSRRRRRHGVGDYVNCPLNKAEYEAFVAAVNAGRKVLPHDFEEPRYFESCMPIEVMAERGARDAARSGRCGRSACAIRAPAIGRGRSSSCAPRIAIATALQPRRLPDPARVPRAAADLPDDPGARDAPSSCGSARSIATRTSMRRRGSARASSCATRPQRPVRGPAHRRRGLHRVVRDGAASSRGCSPSELARPRARPPPPTTMLGGLYHHVTAPRERGLQVRADQRQLRPVAAARRRAQGQPQAADGRARARRPRRVARANAGGGVARRARSARASRAPRHRARHGSPRRPAAADHRRTDSPRRRPCRGRARAPSSTTSPRRRCRQSTPTSRSTARSRCRDTSRMVPRVPRGRR